MYHGVTQSVPMLPIRNAVLFPGATSTFTVGRSRSLALLRALEVGDVIGVFTQKDARDVDVDVNDVHRVGALARIRSIDAARSGDLQMVVVEGLGRARLEEISSREPHLAATVVTIADRRLDDRESKMLARSLAQELEGMSAASGVDLDTVDPGAFADRVAAGLDFPLEDKIAVLAEDDVPARLRVLSARIAEAYAKDDAKKERVIHTRVPAVLERELKRLAEGLRVPVSNLVRSVLEDAVAVADQAGERVEDRLKTFADNLGTERGKIKRRVQRDPLKDVFAFQPVKLAQPASCAKCEKVLGRGSSANLGLSDDAGPGKPRVFVCDDCLPKE
jgi:ATP-dependent Lon protease